MPNTKITMVRNVKSQQKEGSLLKCMLVTKSNDNMKAFLCKYKTKWFKFEQPSANLKYDFDNFI